MTAPNNPNPANSPADALQSKPGVADQAKQPLNEKMHWGWQLVAALLVFGAAIGLLSGLSKQAGTTATLIGLIVSMIGGTLATLVKSDGTTPAQRRQVFCAAGLVCGGVLAGLLAAFGLRWYEIGYLLPDQRKAYVELLSELKEKKLLSGGVTAPSMPDTPFSGSAFQMQADRPSERPTFVPQSSRPEDGASGSSPAPVELGALATACDKALDALRSLPAERQKQEAQRISELDQLRGYFYYQSRQQPREEIARALKIIKPKEGDPAEVTRLYNLLGKWTSGAAK